MLWCRNKFLARKKKQPFAQKPQHACGIKLKWSSSKGRIPYARIALLLRNILLWKTQCSFRQLKSCNCAVRFLWISPEGLFLYQPKQRANLVAYLCSDVELRWSLPGRSENALGSGKGGMALEVLDVPCFKTQISAQFWSKALLADLGVVHREILSADLGIQPVGNGWWAIEYCILLICYLW